MVEIINQMSNIRELNPSQYCTIILIGLDSRTTFQLEKRTSEDCGFIKLEEFNNKSSLILANCLNADRVVAVANEVCIVHYM